MPLNLLKKYPDLFEFGDSMEEGNLHYVQMKDAPHMYEKVYQHVYNYMPAIFTP